MELAWCLPCSRHEIDVSCYHCEICDQLRQVSHSGEKHIAWSGFLGYQVPLNRKPVHVVKIDMMPAT